MESIAELCRREAIAASMYYGRIKKFHETGKRRVAGDIARTTTTGQVKELRREASALKELVADLTLKNRVLKKHERGWGERGMNYPDAEKAEIIHLVEQSHPLNHCHPSLAAAAQSSLNSKTDQPEPPFQTASIVLKRIV